MRSEKIPLLFTLLVFLSPAALPQNEGRTGKEDEMTIPEYITKYAPYAKAEMRRAGIPASITLAQGILESSYGNSKLARKASNHFGIKCGNNWDGPTFIQDDDEEKECFRKYESVHRSYIDHSNFLLGKERYAFLFKLSPKDYKGWAQGLQKAGYATNPQYATLLIRLIEERNLHIYDTEDKYVAVSPEEAEYLKTMDNKFFVFNGIKTVISQPNEMAMDLAAKYDISLSQLLKYNDLSEGDYIPPGSKIYLEPKKTKGYEVYHRVEAGETMHSISQKEGIRLKSLYKKNNMRWGQEPKTGEILCLRKKCKGTPKLKTDEEIKKDIQAKIQQRVDDTVKEKQERETKAIEQNQTPAQETIIEHQPEKKIGDERPVAREEAIPEEKEKTETATEKEPDSETETVGGRQPKYHKVAPQETLYRIALKYKISVEEIRRWNHLASNSLSVGQLLIVGYTADVSDTLTEKENITKPDVKKEEKTVIEKTTSTQTKPEYHTVAPKETLYRIATMYSVTVDDLKKWNKLSSNELIIGQKLIVGYYREEITEEAIEEELEDFPQEQPNVQEQKPSGQPTYHKVQEGETLYTIAQKYKLNVEQLKKLNNLTSNDIRPGQVLKLR
ncbi:MAG TPA: LysM peptidoglycan-binding domain-containing protein [Chitinophagales bacterium]|nr:LysM peptidoglycan-binding domain-containing protein [Chitinophagales bacterium]